MPSATHKKNSEQAHVVRIHSIHYSFMCLTRAGLPHEDFKEPYLALKI